MVQETNKHFLLKTLLSNALPILCKNALKLPDVDFCIEAFVGVTVGNGEDVTLVSIKESILSNGTNISYAWNVKKDSSSLSIKSEPTTLSTEPVCDLTNDDEDEVGNDSNFHNTNNNNNNNIIDNNIINNNNNNNNNNKESNNWRNKQVIIKQENECNTIDTNNYNNDNNNNGNNTNRCNLKRNANRIRRSNTNYSQNYNDDEEEYDIENNNNNNNCNYIKDEILEEEMVDDNIYNNNNNNNDDVNNNDHNQTHLNRNNAKHQQQYNNVRKSFNTNFRNPKTRGGSMRRFARGRARRSTTYTPSANSFNNLMMSQQQQQGNHSYNEILDEMCQQVVDQSMSAEMQYVCHICQARRCSKSSLRNHIRGTHLAMDKYSCKVCGEKFRWFMQLHRHRKKFHYDLENGDMAGESSAGYMDGVGGDDDDCGGGGGDNDEGNYEDDGVGYLDPSVVGGLLDSFGGGGGGGGGGVGTSGGFTNNTGDLF